MSNKYISLLVWLIIGYLPSLSGYFFRADSWYDALVKAPFNPPGWVFAPAWTFLYATIGIVGWLIWRSEHTPARSAALKAFAIQFVFNSAWSYLFFGIHQVGLALVDIALLLLAILYCLKSFSAVKRQYAYFWIPYLAWVSFATLLNFEIWRLNTW
jgi:tryptophan-rich sensory protein